MKAYPEAKVLITGGSGRLTRTQFREAHDMAAVLSILGIERDRLIIESEARNTRENAVLAKRLADPRPGETWLLVTSAFHMPRAVGCFRRIDWPIIPFPVDYRTEGQPAWWPPRLDLVGGLGSLGLAVHEWVGLAAYRLTDRTDALFPGPSG